MDARRLGRSSSDLDAGPRATKAKIAWLEALVENMDRTTKNPNVLMWKGRAWPIDHGSAFSFHFAEPPDLSPSPFALRPDHLFASALGELDPRAALTVPVCERIVSAVPLAWAPDPSIYVTWIHARLSRSLTVPGRPPPSGG